jgi:hypothetical protein
MSRTEIAGLAPTRVEGYRRDGSDGIADVQSPASLCPPAVPSKFFMVMNEFRERLALCSVNYGVDCAADRRR